MVGGSMLNLTGGAHEKRRPRCLGMDRRLRFWMGSTYTVRKDGCRSLEGGGKRTPRKPDGDSSSVEPSDVGNLGRLQTCPGVHRQRYSVVRYQQKWLYEVQGSNQKSGKLRDLHKTTRIHVSMLRIPGDQNGFADSLSRGEVMPVEWEVTPHDWNCIQSWTSGLQADLMATPFNRRLREFICSFEHPSAVGTDIRVQDLNRWNAVYVATPHKMLVVVPNLLRGFHGVAVVVARPALAGPLNASLHQLSKEILILDRPLRQKVMGRYTSDPGHKLRPWTACRLWPPSGRRDWT